MNPHNLPIQEQRVLEYLRQHSPASGKEIRNQLGIEHPTTIISRLRAVYGEEAIHGRLTQGRNLFGEKTHFMMYSLTKEGREKIFPVKKPFPGWINAIQRA